MTFEIILHLMRKLGLYIDIIYRKFYQNQFINEYARKHLAKIPPSRSF